MLVAVGNEVLNDMVDNPQALAARAQQAMQEGRLDEALTDLSALKILIPNDASIWLMCAYANRAKGDVETACQEFETACQNVSGRCEYSI